MRIPIRRAVGMMKFALGILNGRVVDGAGNPWYHGDLGIAGKKIAKVGRVERKDCGKTIDAKGMYVCPGFIDIHPHSDLTALVFRGCDSTLRQGVTTHLIGNCGIAVAPLKEPNVGLIMRYWGEWAGKMGVPEWRTFGQYLRVLGKGGLGHNMAALVGHGAIRTAIMGPDRGDPSPVQLRQMKALVDEAMASGGFGMSTGLVYPPRCFGKADDILE